MKKNILILILFTVLASSCSTLQKATQKPAQSFEGKIIFDITYSDSQMPVELMSQLASEATLYIKNNKIKSVSNSEVMETQVIKDVQTKTITRLFDIMGQKYLIKSRFDEQNTTEKQLIFTKHEKIIDGYPCKQVLIQDNDKTDTVYYSPEIGNASCNFDMPDFKNINGIPLVYSVKTSQFSITLHARKILKEKVSNKIFKIPSDYQEITEKELQQMFIE